MIAYLDGKIISRSERSLILNVGGVGYEVFVGPAQLEKAAVGQEIQLFCFTHVKKDALDLYGFNSKNTLRLFKMLLNISGIGPKIALDILSLGPPKRIEMAISQADVDFFTELPRLGRKNAQKIIIELKSKIGGLKEIDLAMDTKAKEILAALKSLGFTSPEARRAYRAVRDKTQNTQEAVKEAIRYLGKAGGGH